MADFTGFYLGGIHSSTYGILRVSDGDRYSEGLIPEFDNIELELSGGNGDLYGGKKFKKTPFEIKIAFEHLTEKQFREMRNWLGKTEPQSFRFDERPYKTYWVTLASRPELEYVCFMEEREDGLIGEKERIYKGEGELEFVAYSPFGYCIDESTSLTHEGLMTDENKINWQELDSYSIFNIKDDNVIEWAEVSGLKRSLNDYNVFTASQKEETWKYTAKLYNPGDFDTDFELLIDLEDGKDTVTKGRVITITITDEKGSEQFFQFSIDGLHSLDKIVINTKKHGLEVYSVSLSSQDQSYSKSLRYDLVKSTHWISIPKGESEIKIECGINGLTPKIKYNYKYY